MLGKLLSLLFADLAFVFQVTLISHKHFTYVVVRKFIYFMHPLADVFKGLSICDIIDNNNSVCAPIVTGGERPKPLLSGGIPNLELNILAVHFYGLYFEIHSDCVEKVLVK